MNKLLIANRGEIALRIIRAAKELGLQTVAIYAKADQYAVHRFAADEAYQVGTDDMTVEAYLDIPAIIEVAKAHHVDAIHPGYGFLSENAEFAQAISDAGMKFVGPKVAHLEMFGDKIKAKQAASAANVASVPGTDHPVETLDEALAIGEEYGYPLFVKSAAGGGGRGMRVVEHAEELKEAFQRAASEAKASFGKSDVYLEKYLQDPKHIEIQILADEHGQVMHLFERDSSVQRRHQKIIEFAPAVSIKNELREQIQAAAVRLMASVGYQSAATVEFLVEGDDFYFIEVNPRVQVEHTVTEVVTDIDIVRSQLLIAMGYGLHEEPLNLPEQDQLKEHGVAVQARITTEDPANDFMPDSGTIRWYQQPAGPGIRVDAGTVYAGAKVTPYFDSLLLKIIAQGRDFDEANTRMERALHELQLEGVKTNTDFLVQMFAHPTFTSGQAATTFVDDHGQEFIRKSPVDTQQQLLDYMAEITVNGFPGVKNPDAKPTLIEYTPQKLVLPEDLVTAKDVLDAQGPDQVVDWIKGQSEVLLTDTTMRDAHQSRFATRFRTKDMVDIAEQTQTTLPNLFSNEMWGGATFDTAYRFLDEDPWDRLKQLREKMPRTLTQMLFRGSNAVGYQNYPDNVIQEFIHLAAKNGMDVFRIFDSLNWLPQMETSIQAVRDENKLAEVTMAYTGDILDPSRTKYTLQYYVDFAKQIEAAGAHILAIKDMSGLLKPEAAYQLVSTLKNEIDLPIHLHTHDTTGIGVSTYARAVEAGVDIIDVAQSAMASTTSQPSLSSTYYALSGNDRQPTLDMPAVERLNQYWQGVVPYYQDFENGMRSPQTDIFEVEMPGGQYSNLQQQANALHLGDRWNEIKQMYAEVNQLFGDIIKVTPSSKVVGDMALFMVQNDLTPDDIYAQGAQLDFPQSVVDFFKGDIGQPVGGFPTDLQAIILKGQAPLTERPGALAEPYDLSQIKADLTIELEREPTPEEVISKALYPEVFSDYEQKQAMFGPTTVLDTPTFFYGLKAHEETVVQFAPGIAMVVTLNEMSAPDADGVRTLYMALDGRPVEVTVHDQTVDVQSVQHRQAKASVPGEIGATMAGNVVKVSVAVGDEVAVGDTLVITEAMKMETTIQAPVAGTVSDILVQAGDQIAAGDLLLTISE